MKLTYKTRGDSSPQGKSRVWYTGHPAEIGPLGEEIIADILHSENCAVYYDAEPDVPPDAPSEEEELLRELSQMQLFVIAVTSRFLYQPCRAREIEFRYAMQNHIPVLPLLQEQGLEAAFNRICGDLQMLNKNNPDPTALPYAEKLEKFLSAVLVGDELAAKIRAAFDAYVFLSYRKKDRKYAQELMRLIHKNEFCRDIAIWYDEFLTPGEDFNHAIAQALHKCSLFTLAVTPSLLEPGNYVMELEYPEAKKAGKPVLPVELAPTDRAALEGSFEGLPPCTSARDEAALSRTLLDAVRRLAIGQKEGDAQHDFFIGLAYLGGVDVEVDRARALSQITGAAGAGLPEAIEKLVSMYRRGEGVKRDYRAAVDWQKKLAAVRQAAYEATNSEEDGCAWADDLWSLGEYQQEIADLGGALVTFLRMNQLCDSLFASTDAARALRLLTVSQICLGSIYMDTGRLAQAREKFAVCYLLRSEICGKNDTPGTERDLAVICNWMGMLCQAEGDTPGAREFYEQSHTLRQHILKLEPTPRARRDLALSSSRMAGLCREEGDHPAAWRYYRDAFTLCQELAAETGTLESYRSLAASGSKLGEMCQLRNERAEARGYYERGLAIYRKLAERTGSIEDRRCLSVALERMGELCRIEHELAAARRWLQEDYTITKQLWEETRTNASQRDFSVCCGKLGDLCRDENDPAGAKRYYELGHALRRELLEKTGTPEAHRDLAVICSRLGDLCRSEKDLDGAMRFYRQDYDLCKKQAEKLGTVQLRRDLAISCGKLGGLCRTMGDLAGARRYREEDYALSKQLAEETGTVRARRDLSYSAAQLAWLCQVEGDLAGARGYHEESLALRRALAEEAPTPQARQDLALALVRLLDICTYLKDYATAKQCGEEALALYRQLAAELPKEPLFPERVELVQEWLRRLDEPQQEG